MVQQVQRWWQRVLLHLLPRQARKALLRLVPVLVPPVLGVAHSVFPAALLVPHALLAQHAALAPVVAHE